MPIKQLLFDCDNTLVDSEEAAFTVSPSTINAVLARHNIPQTYTPDQITSEFMGQKLKGILHQLQQKYNFVLSSEETSQITLEEESTVMTHLAQHATACDGSLYALYRITSNYPLKVAVVSSSAMGRITTCLETSGFGQMFDTVTHTNIFSAVSSLPAPKTKPDPAVYLHAMEKLEVRPSECVAVEDSKSGALAAVNAGVAACIAYVGSYRSVAKQIEVADTLVSLGCRAVLWHWRDFEEVLQDVLMEIEDEETDEKTRQESDMCN